ncbi:flagellar hook protein FlgE [Tranquillimonas alkanivorans]|uniref:Flagellar hook protein FlgE n=1 Tax=Tranquillimonas alkanivorans TaxID=441119 RepID=A0A1I5S4T6_9RHOB|nr:flagellar hook protein FlgE [Tranquillimonas alkanivorans]SFP65775.1 flagellar hook protein FlgE [Tranquillimonas alkanivorans]
MSITNAMQTGVSGLLATSTRVGKISDNIANANTDGYKRVFADLVTMSTTSGPGSAGPQGVRAVHGADLETAGTLRQTSRATDLAISGDGFFTVSKNPNDPVESNYMLTRAGSFYPDADGNLQNAAGFYLAGYRVGPDGALGQVDRSGFGDLSTVTLGGAELAGRPTTEISLKGNLPSQETGVATPGDPFVSSTEFYSPLGEAQRLQFSWQPGANDNQWQLTISDDAGVDYGSVQVDFHDSGDFAGSPSLYSNATGLAAAPAGFAFDPATGQATITVDNGAVPQEITVSLGAPDTIGGMTQFSGDYSPPEIIGDGSASGSLVRMEIDQSGTMYGIYDNGNRAALFSIPVAQVTNPNGLVAADGNAYFLSRESGAFRMVEAGQGSAGSIASGALESSNVEIAQELTDLIQTQRAYSSNAKIVTTMDEMLDETMRLKR